MILSGLIKEFRNFNKKSAFLLVGEGTKGEKWRRVCSCPLERVY